MRQKEHISLWAVGSPGKTEIFDFIFFRGSSKIYTNHRFVNFRDWQKEKNDRAKERLNDETIERKGEDTPSPPTGGYGGHSEKRRGDSTMVRWYERTKERKDEEIRDER